MKFIPLVISIILAQSAGIIGSFFTASSVATWYSTLTKPLWNPPSWLFAPVWIALYALMGLAAHLVWQNRTVPGAKWALTFYLIQLILNALWSIIFFGMKNPELAFIEIIILLVFIIITTILFWRINYIAGALMIPYILWVSFATFLNFTIWKLN
jgi:translocator protein